jgi:RNA polymerase sigma-70 factor, ECF subfamily
MNTRLPLSAAGSVAKDGPDLQTALRGCTAGDVSALRTVYDLTAARLLGQLVCLYGDRDDAEIALRDCFVSIWNNAASFNPQRTAPWVWLQALVRRCALDQLRERPPTLHDGLDASLLLAQFQPAESEADQPTRALWRCLSMMPGDQRQCLQLAHVCGQSPLQISQVMKTSLDSVKNQIRTGLKSLLDQLPT